MVAEKDPYIANAAKTLYRASADERIRALCEGRERGELTVRTLQLELRQQRQQHEEELEQKDAALQEKNVALLQKDAEIARLLAELNALKQQGS